MDYLRFRRGKWEVRISIPKELRSHFGKTELCERIDVDRSIAKMRAPLVVDKFNRRIEAARSVVAGERPNFFELARLHYDYELEADLDERSVREPLIDAAFKTRFRKPYVALLRLVASGRIEGEEAEAAIGYAANRLADEGKVSQNLRPADRRELLKALAEVQLDALARFEERDEGKPTEAEPKSAFLRETPQENVVELPRRKARGRTLADLLVLFHEERNSGGRTMNANTKWEHEVAVRMLGEFIGPNKPASSITREDMRDYKAALLKTPNRYRQRFPGMSIRQAIDANSKRKEPLPTLATKTINEKWLAHVRAILGWCYLNGYLSSNPADGIKVTEGKGFREPTRVPFSQDDLQRIFGGQFFADPNRYGSQQWALLLALYTGARSSSEVRRLKLADIYEEQGVLSFNLEEASKNLRSKRIVPVHSALIELGLSAYVGKLKAEGRDLLFPDWNPVDKINRWFMRTYMPEVGITDGRKVFHSFRHTLKTAMARAGVPRDVSDLITGHADQSVAGIYIAEQHVTMIQAMKNGLERVNFNLPCLARNEAQSLSC